jgi:hypothetical protein
MKRIFSILFASVLALAIAMVPGQANLVAAATSTVLVDNLQPSWTAPGGGGVYSGYYGPSPDPDLNYTAVSPGATAIYDGREAAPIMAGINVDPDDGHYWDQCLYAFKPNMTIDELAASVLSWDIEAQYGACPVWMYMQIDRGGPNETMFQFVPTSNPAGWHTVDAAAGLWQKWNNMDGDTTGNPLITLSQVAENYTGLNVSRCYLNVGMGDAYHDNPNGTIDWVDKVTIGEVTYDFVVPEYWYVATTGSDTNEGTEASPFLTIQHAIDVCAGAGETIHVAEGTYNGTINVEYFAGLTIVGANKTQVIIKPATTLNWDVGGYGSSRKTAIRVVNSTDIVLESMTLDFDLVKANNVYGVLYWDSTGTLNNNILQNMSVSDAGGGYAEITSCYRAPDYTAEERADITVSGNTFIDPGRLGALCHDYVDMTITGNTFYKTTDDFGYAIELGSKATGTISGNTIYGYDTAALSDGSQSGGIYVENCFTGGEITQVTKDVSVISNEIYDCQWGMFIGNEWDGYAGNVDIDLTLSNNNFHNNTIGGVGVADEDMEDGSSVSISGGGNKLVDNADYGYYIYTLGDGNVTVSLTGETITGHDYGVYVEDTAGESSTSSYSVAIRFSSIKGNTLYGVNNTVSAFDVDARNNWWGSASGPSGVGMGSGDAVSYYVDFDPWALAEFPTAATQAATGTTINSTTLNMAYTMGSYSSVEVRFAYKKASNPSWSYSSGWVSKASGGTHAELFTGLASGTTYDFKAQLRYNDISYGITVLEGATLQFTTPVVPTVTTQPATEVGYYIAHINMSYTVGDFSPVQVCFAYKKAANTEWIYSTWVLEPADGTYTVLLWGLLPNTSYNFKAVLKYNDIVIYGNYLVFSTQAITGGCFIATAAYGTSTAPQLDLLREFRDSVLLQSTLGSQFVSLYYRLSPPIADFIAGHEAVRTLVREILIDPIVWLVDVTGGAWRN